MRPSLKLRLAAVVSLGTAVIAFAAAWGIWRVARAGVAERIDAMLRFPGRRLTERTGWNTDWKRFDRSLALVFGDDWQAAGICRVVGNGPRFPVYYESPNWPEDLVLQHPQTAADFQKPDRASMDSLPVRTPLLYDALTWPDQHWRMVNLANGELTIHLGVRTDRQRTEARRLAMGLGGAVIGLGSIMFALTWLVVRQALRPVGAIAGTAARISARQLGQRIDASGAADREFAELVGTFNEMIGRLERGFHQASRFSADASHELRTPIANLYGVVMDGLRHCGEDSDEQRFLAGLVDELDRLRSVLDGLLLLARADGGRLELSCEPLSVAEFFKPLGEDFAVMTEAAGLRFVFEIECAGARMLADPVMLTQALHNLVRNAVDYNCAAGHVRLEGARTAGELVVRVVNSGSPIAGELRAGLFGRFQKGPQGGHGLGLNIVKEIVEAHGGRVELESSTGGETAFRLTLPTLPQGA